MARPPITDFDKFLAERIRKLREKKGLSSIKLADAAGVSPQQMSRYELGYNKMTCAQLFAIAEAMDVPISWLFYDTDRKAGVKDTSSTTSKYSPLGPQDRLDVITAYWPKLTPQQQNALLAVLDSFSMEKPAKK